jgi:hypothetical protein
MAKKSVHTRLDVTRTALADTTKQIADFEAARRADRRRRRHGRKVAWRNRSRARAEPTARLAPVNAHLDDRSGSNAGEDRFGSFATEPFSPSTALCPLLVQ